MGGQKICGFASFSLYILTTFKFISILCINIKSPVNALILKSQNNKASRLKQRNDFAWRIPLSRKASNISTRLKLLSSGRANTLRTSARSLHLPPLAVIRVINCITIYDSAVVLFVFVFFSLFQACGG